MAKRPVIEFTVDGGKTVKVRGKTFENPGAKLAKIVDKILDKALLKVGNHLAERAKESAPILTGDLRASLTTTPVTGNTTQKSISVVSDIPYALDMHEHQIKTLTGPVIYGLGPLSRQADAAYRTDRNLLGQYTSGSGGVGGSYLVRVFNLHAQSYKDYIKEQLEKGIPAAFFTGGNPNVSVT